MADEPIGTPTAADVVTLPRWAAKDLLDVLKNVGTYGALVAELEAALVGGPMPSPPSVGQGS